MRKLTRIENRVLFEADLMIATYGTVRSIAKASKVSKTTVHRDLTVLLPALSLSRAGKVREILDQNNDEKHLRGGKATQMKYLNNE